MRRKKILIIFVAGMFLLLALSPVISSLSIKTNILNDEERLKNIMEPFFKTHSDYYEDVYTQLEFKKYSPEINKNKPNVVLYDPEYVIVKLTEFGDKVKVFAKTGLWPVDNIPELRSYLYFLDNGLTVDEFIALVEPLSDVEWAECNTLWDTDWIPNDPLFDQQWALDLIDCPRAWDTIKGSDSIKLAIIDSGIDYNHPDLKNVIKGPDFVNNDNDPMDDYGHGTHCAGIAGATMNNGIGIAGVADVTIMAVKVIGSNGIANTWDLAKGMIWATLNEAWIISLSLGSYIPSLLIDLACVYTVGEGPLKNPTVIVAAAGNEGFSAPCFPARFKTVISVGAVDDNYQHASFTNKAFIYAPGVDILSTVPNNQYKKMTGTSMACPHVAGVAALICLKHNTRNFIKVKAILSVTTKNGVVNAALAVMDARSRNYLNMPRTGPLFKLFSRLIEKFDNLDNFIFPSINNNDNRFENVQGLTSFYFIRVLIDYLPKNCYDHKFGLPLLRMPKSFIYGFTLNTYEGEGYVYITKIGGPTQEYIWPTDCSFLSIKILFSSLMFFGPGLDFHETENGYELSIGGIAADVMCY